jgi:Ca-activated chloride channel family protein
MAVLLDPEQSARYLLQPSSKDVTVVIPFDDQPIDQWRVDGNDPGDLRGLLETVTAEDPDGGTAIHRCVNRALDTIEQANLEGYEPAIVLMTDGRSNEDSFDDLAGRLAQEEAATVPVYGILFGNAEEDQLNRIAEATSGRVFDGRDDLIGALRDAKANN